MNIEINNLCKNFKDFSLKDISLNVKCGHIVGLIGENGAGKTTLIKCILNIMKIDKGEVLLFGESFKDSLKEDIGVVFDNSFINLKYNVKDLNLMEKYIHKNWDEELFFSYIKKYEIPENIELKKLSTGMKKKVEIATCMSFHPKLLILDEPTSGLDPIIRSEVLEALGDFVKDGNNSILLSTHITSDLEHIADDVVFISKGSIVFEETIKNIHDNYIILTLEKDEFESFNKDIIIRYKENKNDYLVLINTNNMEKSYNKYIKSITTLDDIMLLFLRGLSC